MGHHLHDSLSNATTAGTAWMNWLENYFNFNQDTTTIGGNEAEKWLNPFQFTLPVLCGALLVKVVAEIVADEMLVHTLTWMQFPKMPSRVPVPVQKGLEKLEFIDIAYLCINQFIEYAFIQQFAAMALISPDAKLRMDELTLWNTVAAFYAIVYLDDFVYFWAHRLMHVRAFYPWVHKHHHRQTLPKRGYFDAGNEHPVEQIIGLSIVGFALKVVSLTLGLHSLTVLVFFSWYAMCSMLNHTEFDVNFGLLGVGYSVRAHETHHRMFTCNYAQLTMLWDRLFGTFREYNGYNKHGDAIHANTSGSKSASKML